MKTRLNTLIFLALIIIAPSYSHGNEFPTRDIDITDYKLSLEIPLEFSGYEIHKNKLLGSATITLKNTGDTELAKIPVILYRLMKVKAISNIEGQALSFNQTLRAFEGDENAQINYVEVTPSKAIRPGGSLSFNIVYHGGLAGFQETGMTYLREKLDPNFTIIRIETFAYPNILYPVDEQRDQIWKDVFNQTLSITVPNGHSAISYLKPLGVSKSREFTTFKYESEKPSGQIMVAVAKYGKTTALNNEIYYLPEDKAGADNIAKAMIASMKLMTSWFGPLKNKQGLKLIEIPEAYGSANYFPAIIQTADAFRSSEYLGELYHELSHLWNVTENEEKAVRWNEGLAMFLQYLVEEKFEANDNLKKGNQRMFESIQRKLKSDEKYQIPMGEYGQNGVEGLSYSGGCVFFGLVYDAIGEERMLKLIAEFYQQYYEKGATTKQFLNHLRALKHATVDQLIQDFFLTNNYAQLIIGADSFQTLKNFYREKN